MCVEKSGTPGNLTAHRSDLGWDFIVGSRNILLDWECSHPCALEICSKGRYICYATPLIEIAQILDGDADEILIFSGDIEFLAVIVIQFDFSA